MSKWTKDTAISELTALIQEIPKLSDQARLSADHTRWVFRTSAVLEEIFGRESGYCLTFASYYWHEAESFIVGGPWDLEGLRNPQGAIERRHQDAYVRDLQSAKGLLQAAVDELKRSDLDSVYKGKDTPLESSTILKVLNLAERKLRKVIRDTPSNEKEIQDAFENLLIGAEIPYSREKDSIEYSSKTYTPDFTMPKIDLAIEMKFCGRANREKEIIAEINDDILAYQTKYGNLIFVVYDCGFIRDVDLFTATFEEKQNVLVRVVKH